MGVNNSNCIEQYFDGPQAVEDSPCKAIDCTTCCGLFELNGIEANNENGIFDFIEKLKGWAEQVKGKQSRDAFFTHRRDSLLYRSIKRRKNIGIKIVHEWTNANTGRELFMAVVSPAYIKQKKASTKKKAVRK